MRKNVRAEGAILAAAGGICWGMSGCMGQFLFQHEMMDTRWLVPIRLGGAGLILLIYCLVRYGPSVMLAPFGSREGRIRMLLFGLAGVSASQFTYFLTIQLSSAAVGTILQDLSPVMILLAGCFTAKRAPRAREILAVLLALAGVTLISTHGDFSSLGIPAAALVSGVLCAVCVTVYNIAPGPMMKEYPVLLLQGWAFVMGSAFFTLLFRPWRFHYVPSAVGVAGIAFVILVGNVMAFPLYMSGVGKIGPEKGILYGFTEPLTAAVIGVLLLGNRFTLWDGIGFILVFAMLVMISGGGKAKKKAEAVPEMAEHAARHAAQHAA